MKQVALKWNVKMKFCVVVVFSNTPTRMAEVNILKYVTCVFVFAAAAAKASENHLQNVKRQWPYCMRIIAQKCNQN